jgi:hypothetical protein
MARDVLENETMSKLTFSKSNLGQLPAYVRQRLMTLKLKHRRGHWWMTEAKSQRVERHDRGWLWRGSDGEEQLGVAPGAECGTLHVDLAEGDWLLVERHRVDGVELTAYRGMTREEREHDAALEEDRRLASIQHRKEHWEARVKPASMLCFYGSPPDTFEVSASANGRQFTALDLTPEEWDKLCQAVEAYRATGRQVKVTLAGGVRKWREE